MLCRQRGGGRIACDNLGELFAVQRLGNEIVHSGGEAGLADVGGGIRRQCDNRRMPRALYRFGDAYAARAHSRPSMPLMRRSIRTRSKGSPAACAARNEIHRGVTIGDDGRAMTELLQQRTREQRIDLVVLGNKDRQPIGTIA